MNMVNFMVLYTVTGNKLYDGGIYGSIYGPKYGYYYGIIYNLRQHTVRDDKFDFFPLSRIIDFMDLLYYDTVCYIYKMVL